MTLPKDKMPTNPQEAWEVVQEFTKPYVDRFELSDRTHAAFDILDDLDLQGRPSQEALFINMARCAMEFSRSRNVELKVYSCELEYETPGTTPQRRNELFEEMFHLLTLAQAEAALEFCHERIEENLL